MSETGHEMLPEANVPKSIGRYQVLKELGAGAMGSVLLAEDPRIKRKVAIKIVRLEALRSRKDQEEYLARFQREAEISGLLNHPGIVTIYDVGEEEGIGPFLAMEFVGGQTLEALLKSGIPVSLDQKFRIAASISEALDHAHVLGVIHRDVKPGNVMLTEDGRPKLMDFGIAKREDAGLTQTGTFLGTPSYAAPEQIKEGQVTPRSDQFSFAVMVFELFSGKLPFPGTSINTILYRIVNEPPADPRPPVEGILPDAWHAIFLRALSKEPMDRFTSCSHFMRDLADAAEGLGAQVRQELPSAGKTPESFSVPPVAISTTPLETYPSGITPILTPDPKTLVAPIFHIGAEPDDEVNAALHESRHRSPWPWVALVVVAVGTGGYFLWNRPVGTTILLKTNPDKAAVSLNGRALPDVTPLQQAVKPGDHLRFEAKGFHPKEVDFSLGSAWPGIVNLDPIVGPVELNTQPEGAKVVLDGKSLDGVTPMSVSWNQGQPHQVTFSKDAATLPKDFAVGEIPSTTFQIQPPTATAAAESGNGTLKIAGSFPVRLKVDGVDKGEVVAGRSLELPPGEHRVDLSNPKFYFSDTRTLAVSAGKETKLPLPGTAKLSISTHPGVGDVFVDGRPAGIQSDGSSVQVALGRHTVTIRSLSGKTANQTLSVQADKSLALPL